MRLLLAAVAAALIGGVAWADEPTPSVIIASTNDLRFRQDIQAALPGQGADELCVYCEVFEGDFRVERSLSGPDLGSGAKILISGHHLARPHPQKRRMFMIVRRDKDGGLWAGSAWLPVGSELCLAKLTIRQLDVEAAFANGRTNAAGEICIRV